MMSGISELLADAGDSGRILQTLLDNAPVGIVIAGAPDARVRFVNRYARETIAGGTPDELSAVAGEAVSEAWQAYYADRDEPARPEDLPLTRAVKKGEVIRREEWRLRCRDGRFVSVLCSAAPVRDAEGRVTAGVVVWQDKSASTRAEQALRESESRFRAILENSLDAAYRRDLLADRYDYMSPVIKKITGYSAEELNDMSVAEVLEHIHPDDHEAVAAGLAATEAEGAARIIYRFRHRDGSFRWMADFVTITRGGDGRPRYRTGVMRDISDAKRREEELRELTATLESRVAERTAQLQALAMALTQAEERERRRVAGVLHDHLQQLLAAARMNMGFLRMQTDPTSEAGAAAENVDALLREAIQSSRTLTYELSPPILHQAGLVPALEWLADDMQARHSLTVEVEGELSFGRMSEAMRVFLFRAVRELLFNVVKHAGTDRARVSLTEESARLRIVVSDEGRGFDASTALAGGGKAFGLYSLRERIALFGGSMDVASAPGRGSRFTLVVPLVLVTGRGIIEAPAAAPAEERSASAEASCGDSIRVLVADDHQVMRKGLMSLLAREPDIEVVGEAGNGQEAVDMARRLRPEVVIMDVSMPVLDGIDATRMLRRETPEVRVVGLSLFEEGHIARRMLDAGASAYLTKSGPSEALLAAIRAGRPAVAAFGDCPEPGDEGEDEANGKAGAAG